MPRKQRWFDTLSDTEKRITLIRFLMYALQEPEASRKRWKTDTIGIALQFAGKRVKREDFDLLKGFDIGELLSYK